jgi:hypothetical protein
MLRRCRLSRRLPKEGPPLRAALPLSSRAPAQIRGNADLGAGDPLGGKDPAHGCRRSRRWTMRHWITWMPRDVVALRKWPVYQRLSSRSVLSRSVAFGDFVPPVCPQRLHTVAGAEFRGRLAASFRTVSCDQ